MPSTRSTRSKPEPPPPPPTSRPSRSAPARGAAKAPAAKAPAAKAPAAKAPAAAPAPTQRTGRARGKPAATAATAAAAAAAAAPKQPAEFYDALKEQPELLLESSVGGGGGVRGGMAMQLRSMFERMQRVSKVACSLPQLYTDGFEGEQIWEQVSILDDVVQQQCGQQLQLVTPPPAPPNSICCLFLTPSISADCWWKCIALPRH
jgi:hypothetical protein